PIDDRPFVIGFRTVAAHAASGMTLRGLGFLLLPLRFLAFGGFLAFFLLLRAVEELDQRHGRVVALAEAVLEDAQIPAVARLVARAELVEELPDDVAVPQPIEGEAPVGERRVLAERDDGLGDAAQLLRLRQRR